MSASEVRITLRIPGDWSHPGKLMERLPDGFRITGNSLVMPDGSEVDITPLPADEQFPAIFESSCRRPAAPHELTLVHRYTINIILSGPGGSLESAAGMMKAAAALIDAGGAGVFIDNCGLAHGGEFWNQMTDDGSSDALSFAFVSIIRGDQQVYTMGMHVLGFPEILMRRSDADANQNAIIEIIRYIAASEKPIGDGHLLADEQGPRFQTVAIPAEKFEADSPMFNPFGMLKLVNMKDIASGN
jgi:hypothetical protein